MRLRFDDLRGEPSNMDLVVQARDWTGDYLIAVEGKADEPFGATVKDQRAAAAAALKKNPRSGALTRITQLLEYVIGFPSNAYSTVDTLRYQLLTATSAAIHEARRRQLGRAAFLVHEFRTSKTSLPKHHQNAADLDAFVRRLGGPPGVTPGMLYGPYTLPGERSQENRIRLFIGKVFRDITSTQS